MSHRRLFTLGTGSQVPTRERNQQGAFLRWDTQGFLFDPGEGTQRSLTGASIPASRITAIFISHFHGDHCLGLPGVIQRISLDKVSHPVRIFFPASGRVFYERLRDASIYLRAAALREIPVTGDGVIWDAGDFIVEARRLDHVEDTYGYRVTERDSRRMLPDRLAAAGLAGPEVGQLQRQGRLEKNGRIYRLDDFSEPRPGQTFAFILDTRPSPACLDLARHADLALVESTYLDRDASLAREYGHMTAAQAGELARSAGIRRLVLTHFSQRYRDAGELAAEAAAVCEPAGCEVIAAYDGLAVDVPDRPPTAQGKGEGEDKGRGD